MSYLSAVVSRPVCRAGKHVKAVGLIGVMMPLAAQADFVEDSQLKLGLRNFFVDRDFKGDNPRTSRDGSWSQGFDLRFTSGYTPGTLQFGLDAAAQYAFRLDGGGGRGPDSVLPYSQSHQRQATEYGRAALTGKVRLSRTGATQMFLGVYGRRGKALVEEYSASCPGETMSRALVRGVDRARALATGAAPLHAPALRRQA